MTSSLSSTCFKSSSMSLRSVSTVKFTSLRILVTSLLTRLSRTGWIELIFYLDFPLDWWS
jgi:hypothetical protein